MIGTGRPVVDSPMRREKNRSVATGVELNVLPVPMLNDAAFSRKKSRFSGNSRPKRVRFTCCSSASTWAKSVL
jgi:hypothetical protein